MQGKWYRELPRAFLLMLIVFGFLLTMLTLVPPPAKSTTESSSRERVSALIVRYAEGVHPGSSSSPTGSKFVSQPQRSWMRVGESLGERMFTIRLTRSVSQAVARNLCKQLSKDRRILWVEPDSSASIARNRALGANIDMEFL